MSLNVKTSPIKKPTLLSRREMLRILATASLALPCSAEILPAIATAESLPSCIVRPQQTAGPFFVEEKLNRSDIRSDPTDGSVKPGVPLRLGFHVSRIDGRSCAPLAAATVHIWQCDASGLYSDVRDARRDTRGKKFLRGYQVTNTSGTAEFLTIYPGWYPGRTVHIHFKIGTDTGARRVYEFTSQLYFDETVTDEVHKLPPYNSRAQRRTTNAMDGLFRSGGKDLLLGLTKDAQGYAATFEIGLQIV